MSNKLIFESWRKFLTEQETEQDSGEKQYLGIKATLKTPTPQVSKKNEGSDSQGTFVHIMSDEIENQLKNLEKMPDGTVITIDLPKYLDALYPKSLFPGGWEKVWADAQAIRKNKRYGVGGKLYWRPKPLKIIKNNKLIPYGSYNPVADALFVNFSKLRKVGKDPLQTIVHELGHCINNGPSESRMNAEAQMEIAQERGYGLGTSYRPEETANYQGRIKAGMGKKNIYDELSNLGRMIFPNFKKEKPQEYERIKNILSVDGNNSLLYVLSRSESQQRYYRPMKFWFAKIFQRAKKEKKFQFGEVPNLGDPNFYTVLKNFATSADYEDLAYQIEQATKGTPVPEVRDYIVEKIRSCKQDPNARTCLMNQRGLYPEIVSTVKADSGQSSSQEV